jgi:hypothetical protein
MPAMFAPPSGISLLVRRLAALVLVLWLAGVACIIGCEMNTAAATVTRAPGEAAQTATEGESCDTTAGHDCCQKKKGGGTPSLRSSQTGSHSSCCPLAALSADPARKLGTKNVPLALAGKSLQSASARRIPAELPSYKLRVPDRGSTHLRLCVFLI